MSSKLINDIADLENLYWAWEKLKAAYKDGADIWVNQFDIACFELELDENLSKINVDILNGSYILHEIYPIAYPKTKDDNGNHRTRPTYYINVRDQLTWIAVINIIGLKYDYQMPFWSFGHRLFITTWLEQKNSQRGILKYGWYRNTSKKIYRNWRQSWPRFRRHISLTIKAMSGQLYNNGGIQNNLTEAELAVFYSNEYESRKFLKNKYLDQNRWKGKDVYWCSIDFSKFYPSLKKEVILKSILNFSKNEIKQESEVYDLINRLLDFKLSSNSGWTPKDLSKIGITTNNDIGLPTGLIVAGFLSNIAMLEIDRQNQEFLDKNLNVACFRFVDDHIILSSKIEDIKVWYLNYLKIIKEYGIFLNEDKTEPKEFINYLKDENLKEIRNKLKLDPLNPTPLVTQTLLKLSMIAEQDLNLLTENNQENFLKDIEHFFLAEFSENEIKKETQVSFALTILSRLIPNLKNNYSKLNEIRKEKQILNNKTQILINRKKEQDEINSLKSKYQYKVEKYYSLILKSTIENYTKPKLWLRLIQYCAKTGKADISNIFKSIDKLLLDNQLNKINWKAINILIITIICDTSNYILSKYLKDRQSVDAKELSFIKKFFSQKNLKFLLNRLNGNTLDISVTRKMLLLTFRFIYDNLQPQKTDLNKKCLKPDDLIIYDFENLDNNISIAWALQKLNDRYSINDYWIDLTRKANSEDKLFEIFSRISTYKNEPRSINKSETSLTLDEFIFINAKKSLDDNLLFTEYSALMISKKLINLFKREFHGINRIDTSSIKLCPNKIQINNLPTEIITDWYVIKNEIESKIELNFVENEDVSSEYYVPKKIYSYDNKQLIEIYFIGVILWQLCNKNSKLPYTALYDKGRSLHLDYNNESIISNFSSSYSSSIIESCLSNVNRETSFWAMSKIKLPNFSKCLQEELISKNYPPLIKDLTELEKRIDIAIESLEKNQLSLKNNIGRQLKLISCQKPTSSFDILVNKNKKLKYENELKIGLIQTTLNKNIAWNSTCNIEFFEGERIWNEIVSGINSLNESSLNAKIIILPELTIPRKYISYISRMGSYLNAIIIAGLDYKVIGRKILNEAIVVIPNNWPANFGYSYRNIILGKYHYAKKEKEAFKRNGLESVSNPNIYIFDTITHGIFGIAICADFFDIERFAIYKGKIQHLFILAYNQDISSFYFLAEAIGRLVYCNVVICNTGFYGGSIVFSPYNSSFKRYKYKHEGAELFTSQIVNIPVNNLINAQLSDDENDKLGEDRFKYAPPGYREERPLIRSIYEI